MDKYDELFVSPEGNDENQGTKASPYLTLKRAISDLSNLTTKDYGTYIWLREGTYYLDETVSIPASASGTSSAPVYIQAYMKEAVTLSGALAIKGTWVEHGSGIFKCHLKDMAFDFSQVFVNGKRQVRARYPNKTEGPYIYPKKVSEWPVRQVYIDPDTFTKRSWSKPSDGVIHIFGASKWGNLQWQITGLNKKVGLISLGKGGFQINDIMQGEEASGIDQRSGYFIENIFEELDSPGEWYYNSEDQDLYLMPEEGVDLNDALVEVSHLETLIEFKGNQDKPIEFVTLSGLTLTGSETSYFNTYEAPSLGDWTIHRGGAVMFEGAAYCGIRNCSIKAVGGNGVFVNLYNRHIRIENNEIEDVGESGICIVGNKQMAIGSNTCYPQNILVHNNGIHHIGVFGKQTAGVFMSVTCDNTISHNHIYEVPRAGICINDGTWGGHLIEFNDVHDTVKETCDHGCFNAWGRDRFWCLQQSHGPVSHSAGNVKLDARKPVVIRNNRFVDKSGWGIDLDDGASNYHIYNNLCIGISIKLREGDYRLVENNMFINPANPPGIHVGYENNHDRFVRNIIVTKELSDHPEVDVDFIKDQADGSSYEFIGPPSQGGFVELMDHNLFYNGLGKFSATVYYRPLSKRVKHVYDLSQWQAMGLDQHGYYGDPMFVDEASGNYHLLEGSPAFKLGFKAFDLEHFGRLA